MIEFWGVVLTAFISGVFILAGTFLTVRGQLKSDREQREKADKARIAKQKADDKARAEENGIDLAKLKKEIEAELWLRLEADFKDEQRKRKDLEVIVTRQGTEIIELKRLLADETAARVRVERENARLKRENGQLKKGQGGRRI